MNITLLPWKGKAGNLIFLIILHGYVYLVGYT